VAKPLKAAASANPEAKTSCRTPLASASFKSASTPWAPSLMIVVGGMDCCLRVENERPGALDAVKGKSGNALLFPLCSITRQMPAGVNSAAAGCVSFFPNRWMSALLPAPFKTPGLPRTLHRGLAVKLV
jgi:hypothetical protein